jgi:hypothetical protein
LPPNSKLLKMLQALLMDKRQFLLLESKSGSTTLERFLFALGADRPLIYSLGSPA